MPKGHHNAEQFYEPESSNTKFAQHHAMAMGHWFIHKKLDEVMRAYGIAIRNATLEEAAGAMHNTVHPIDEAVVVHKLNELKESDVETA